MVVIYLALSLVIVVGGSLALVATGNGTPFVFGFCCIVFLGLLISSVRDRWRVTAAAPEIGHSGGAKCFLPNPSVQICAQAPLDEAMKKNAALFEAGMRLGEEEPKAPHQGEPCRNGASVAHKKKKCWTDWVFDPGIWWIGLTMNRPGTAAESACRFPRKKL